MQTLIKKAAKTAANYYLNKVLCRGEATAQRRALWAVSPVLSQTYFNERIIKVPLTTMFLGPPGFGRFEVHTSEVVLDRATLQPLHYLKH